MVFASMWGSSASKAYGNGGSVKVICGAAPCPVEVAVIMYLLICCSYPIIIRACRGTGVRAAGNIGCGKGVEDAIRRACRKAFHRDRRGARHRDWNGGRTDGAVRACGRDYRGSGVHEFHTHCCDGGTGGNRRWFDCHGIGRLSGGEDGYGALRIGTGPGISRDGGAAGNRNRRSGESFPRLWADGSADGADRFRNHGEPEKMGGFHDAVRTWFRTAGS